MSDGRKSILFTSHYSLNGGLMQLGVSAEGKAQLVREQEKSTPNIIVVARELAFFLPTIMEEMIKIFMYPTMLRSQKQSFKSLFCFGMQEQERRNKAVN